MKTPNTWRLGGSSGPVRALILAGTLVAASACAPAASVATEPIPVTSASTVARSADRVSAALSEVSLRLSTQMTAEDEDVILAWTDFERDVRSVVEDLISRPSRIDIEGMQQRVEGLGDLLAESQLELPASEWDEFVSAFQTLMNEASTASART
ncbi:MAG: hypothetical protein ACFCU2_13360 [Acidimicrobiia bacterium]